MFEANRHLRLAQKAPLQVFLRGRVWPQYLDDPDLFEEAMPDLVDRANPTLADLVEDLVFALEHVLHRQRHRIPTKSKKLLLN